MKIMQEITVWKEVSRQPNHVYLMDGDKAYGYSKWGEGPAEYFKNPLRLDRRGRKFVEVKQNPWKFKITVTKPTGRTWEVAGSKGGTYTVTEEGGTWSCTCSGFTFRGRCRHIAEQQG